MKIFSLTILLSTFISCGGEQGTYQDCFQFLKFCETEAVKYRTKTTRYMEIKECAINFGSCLEYNGISCDYCHQARSPQTCFNNC